MVSSLRATDVVQPRLGPSDGRQPMWHWPVRLRPTLTPPGEVRSANRARAILGHPPMPVGRSSTGRQETSNHPSSGLKTVPHRYLKCGSPSDRNPSQIRSIDETACHSPSPPRSMRRHKDTGCLEMPSNNRQSHNYESFGINRIRGRPNGCDRFPICLALGLTCSGAVKGVWNIA
jgi:hypothetical protein